MSTAQSFNHRLYEHRQAQKFERATLEAKDTLRSSKELAQEFLTRTAGDPTEAMHLVLRHVRAPFPGFVPRRDISTPGERLYNRVQKAVGTYSKIWSN